MKSLAEVEAAGGYSVIYTDNPWTYRDGQNPRGGANRKYKTLSLAELCALPVERLAAQDCALFSWGTRPLPMECFAVAKAWGFRHVTEAFTWVKTNQNGSPFISTGHWTRANTEGCQLFVRGKPKRVDASVSQVVLAPVGEHSEKPAEVRDRIVKLMGDVPAIELFARERVPGWDCWGNDPRIGEPDVDLGLGSDGVSERVLTDLVVDYAEVIERCERGGNDGADVYEATELAAELERRGVHV